MRQTNYFYFLGGHSIKKIFIPKIFKIVSVVVALLIVGIIWQSVMLGLENNKYVAVGEYVDVETYKAHYYSRGDGDIAFVFITGSGTPSSYTDFYSLQKELSTKGQTITFDHAGSGWSTETESERSIENLTRELSVIVGKVASGKPIVLVCHSLGSLEAIGYAQAYPENVAGIIFLDSGSPECYSNYSELAAEMINRSFAFTRTIGVNRLLGECGLLLPMYGENIRNEQLPDNIKDLDKAMFYQAAGNPSSLNSIKLMNENANKILEGTSLNDIPILVLSSDNGQQWEDVQLQLAAWSINSKQVTIKRSKHYLYWSNYEEVVIYINEFINQFIS
jgi:pimeloyl-ACP methyl ester carboxylesterase